MTQPRARPGFLGRLLGGLGKAIRWVLLSLLVSIAIEWLGMLFWWPEAGLDHSRQMLRDEIAYLDGNVRHSLMSSDPGQFARTMAKRLHYYLFEVTGVVQLIDWLSMPANNSEPRGQAMLRDLYQPAEKFVLAAVQIVQVFSVRLAILCLATPLFVLFSLVGLVDGLVQRDLRRWGGGRESSYVYHYAKRSVWMFVLAAWVSYLALPVSVHPIFIVLPFAILFAMSISLTASSFKKYL
jgi:integrating conjugative element membrane protein (TIGR03747 family)